jgi:4-aminobutyrate aminotransferase-like enzyme
VRLFERMRGRNGGPELWDDAVYDYAATQARLNLALRAFFHPAGERRLLWDLKQAAGLRPLLDAVADPGRRRIVATVLDRFEQHVAPVWPRLRAQVVHGDFNLDNVLLGDDERVSAIVDFGDIGYTAQVADLAIALASLMRGRPADDVFRIGRIARDGYMSRIPLEPTELDVLADLVAARLAMIVTISAWRVARFPENAEYIQAWDADSWALLRQFAEVGADDATVSLGGTRPRVDTEQLARRRHDALGPAITALTYRRPVHVVRGEGVWLFDADGRRLLDAYNNVPVVGHCHPRVTEAVVRQTRALNTHARYLYEPLVELAERLVATMPPDTGLDTVFLVNSGSEANDLAWRIATAVTGNTRAIVTSHAYHGVTQATTDFSPEEWPSGFAPPHVIRATPSSALDVEASGVAATYVDTGFTSDGIVVPPAGWVSELARATNDAGGLFVADEVQAGHGRTGEHLWSFVRYGITPDIVTLGKPMGNGYPVAALVMRAEIAERFAQQTQVFSTFGGNPVAAAAAIAVLDVIADERVVERAARVGARLLKLLEDVRTDDVVDVRGRGLLIGVELRSADTAQRVVDAMRDDGVLIGRTGPEENVLKIRPPLAFADGHADILVDALERALRT